MFRNGFGESILLEIILTRAWKATEKKKMKFRVLWDLMPVASDQANTTSAMGWIRFVGVNWTLEGSGVSGNSDLKYPD